MNLCLFHPLMLDPLMLISLAPNPSKEQRSETETAKSDN